MEVQKFKVVAYYIVALASIGGGKNLERWTSMNDCSIFLGIAGPLW